MERNLKLEKMMVEIEKGREIIEKDESKDLTVEELLALVDMFSDKFELLSNVYKIAVARANKE